jgi:hypothetical protein
MSARVKRKRRKPSTYVVQPHHITYKPEWIVPIFKGEHFSITTILRRKRVSQGFLIALADFVEKHKGQAEVLPEFEEVKTEGVNGS